MQTPAQRLKLARVIAGYRTARAFSDKHGIAQSTYSLHESGGRGLTEDVAEEYARFLGNCSPGWLQFGEGRSPMNGVEANPTHQEVAPAALNPFYIVGSVEADAWREAIELPQEEWEPVQFEARPEYQGAKRFGLRVRGQSMNEHYPPGSILDCVNLIDIHRQPQHGDHVVVYRRGPSDLIEATVKELVINGLRWELWPRSTHPAHAMPLVLDHPPSDEESEDVRIVALVIGSYRRRA